MGTSSLNNIGTSFQPAGRRTKPGLRRAEIEFQKTITSRKRCFSLGYTDTPIHRYRYTIRKLSDYANRFDLFSFCCLGFCHSFVGAPKQKFTSKLTCYVASRKLKTEQIPSRQRLTASSDPSSSSYSSISSSQVFSQPILNNFEIRAHHRPISKSFLASAYSFISILTGSHLSDFGSIL